MLRGKRAASDGVVSRQGERGRMARPLVVPHSGKTAIRRFGLAESRARRVVRPGWDSKVDRSASWAEGERAARMAERREMRRTLREDGWEATKMGSKTAAR